MRTLLIFPPASDPAHPPAGIAALAAYLGHRGEEVALLDLNVRAYNELLSSRAIARFSENLEMRLQRLESQPLLQPGDFKEYRTVVESLLATDFLVDRVDDAMQRLRDPDTYASHRAYGEVTSIVRRAQQFVSAAHFPSEWCPGGFSMRYRDTRSADVLAAALDRIENPFVAFFEDCLPLIRDARAGLIGISLNYHCQMIPAMTLAAVVRKELPDTPIVVGGGLVGFFSPDWQVLAPFRALVDAWIPFEGEIPLHRLTQALRSAAGSGTQEEIHTPAVAAIDGILRFDGESPLYRPPTAPPELSDLAPPRFEGLRLHDYLAPEPILPVLASRGCYWGRCGFCSHGQLYRGRFRSLRASDVLALLEKLSRTYSASCFYFVDEAMPPPLASRLAERIADAALPFTWFTETRFESSFDSDRLAGMAAGGCRMLMFGLESSVPRVLDHMDKGIKPDVAARILGDCADAGIRSFVMFFVGFPTETRAEAEKTVAFLDEVHDTVAHAAFTQFVLDRHAPVFGNPARYGIEELWPFPDEDLKTWWQYRVKEGMTATEAGTFVADIHRHPRIRPPDRPYLLSRSHLAFLPVRHDMGGSGDSSRTLDTLPCDQTMPLRRPGLVPGVLAFNLDDVNERLAQGATAPLERRRTHYVFSSERERLIEIGEDGADILGACDGTVTVSEILAAVGPANRDATMQFLSELQARDFIEWRHAP